MANRNQGVRQRKRRRANSGGEQSDGPSTDSDNRPVIDPTENVLALVAAESRRQDDLRTADARLHENEVACLKEIADLRERHSNDLRLAEAQRIDAIRAVDVGAVNRAAEVATTQATTLATQVATVAETLRTQVAAAATASTTALAAALEPIQKDVSDLRQVQFQQQGERVARVEDRGIQVTDRGQSNWLIGVVISAAGLLLAIIVVVLDKVIK